MKSESNRPITIEDLLRLKRAERPPAEFWTDFDRELRAKQLAALVEKRPWWQNLPRFGPVFSRYRLPLGASAVLAITFFSIRDHRATSSAQPEREIRQEVVSPAESGLASQSVVAPTEVASATQSIASSATQLETVTVAPAVLVASDATSAKDISRVIALGGGTETEAPQTRSVRYVEGSLAVAATPDRFASRGLLSASTGFEAPALTSRGTIEPLQQMSLPSDARRSRLLTAMVSTASLETSARTTERAASRILQERLYDQAQLRFVPKADRLQVKF